MCLAIPGRIESITGDDLMRTAQVDFGGVSRSVNLAVTPEAKVGDWVLVHVGMAINVIDEEAAKEVIADLEQLRALDDHDGEPST